MSPAETGHIKNRAPLDYELCQITSFVRLRASLNYESRFAGSKEAEDFPINIYTPDTITC